MTWKQQKNSHFRDIFYNHTHFSISLCIGILFVKPNGYELEATFTLSDRNRINLIHDGYEFKKHRTTKYGAIYWLCKRNAEFKCKVKAFTKHFGGRDFVKVTGVHTHPIK